MKISERQEAKKKEHILKKQISNAKKPTSYKVALSAYPFFLLWALTLQRLGVNEDSFCFQKEMNAFTCLNLLI